MPGPLSEDEIQEILEAWNDDSIDDTYKATAEETGYSEETVSKYVKKRAGDSSEAGSGSETETDSDPKDEDTSDAGDEYEGFTAPPPENTRQEVEQESDQPNFRSMSEADFILWFFDTKGNGVAENFAQNVAEQCRVRGELPDRDRMMTMLLQGSSRIGNDFDAAMIADNYAAAKKRWSEANGVAQPQQGPVRQMGGWESPGQNQQGQQQQARGQPQNGSWEQTRGENQSKSQQRGWGGPGQQQQSQPQQQQPQPGQQQASPQSQPQQSGGESVSPEIRELKEQINELKEAQVAMMQSQQQDPGQTNEEVRTMKERFQEIQQIQQMINNMSGDDGNDEQYQRLAQELKNLKREMQHAQEESGGGGINIDGDGGGVAALAHLASQDGMDPDTLGILADSMGVTDPEVKRAEFEYKKEKERMRNRQELMDNFFDNIGDVSGDLVGAAMQAFGGNGDDGQQQQQQQTAGPLAQQGQQDDGPTVRQAADPDLQEGDFQSVPGGNDQQQQRGQDEEMSPTKQRHSDFFSQNGNGGQQDDPLDDLEDDLDEHSPARGETEFRSIGGDSDGRDFDREQNPVDEDLVDQGDEPDAQETEFRDVTAADGGDEE